MLSSYLNLALKVLLRRKFYTFISLFGISFTLLVLMIATAMIDHMIKPHPPETHLDRMLIVSNVRLIGPRGSWGSNPGYRFLDRHVRNVEGMEAFTMATSRRVGAYRDGVKIESEMMRTDAAFWEMFTFRFLEGGPWLATDEEQGNTVAVINAATRELFFDGQPAVGRDLVLDQQTFRVVGVVENVARYRPLTFADLWVPISSAPSSGYRHEFMGGFRGMILAPDRRALPTIQRNYQQMLSEVELPDPAQYDRLVSSADTLFERVAREMFSQDEGDAETGKLQATLALGALLFLLLPTVNLVNINLSRIMERSSEIGVRKAFGASAWVLIGQFVMENVVLTLIGGLIGFVLSALTLVAFNESGLIPYANFGVNIRVFLWGLALAVLFGLLSGVYPAWKMSRLHPVEALRGENTVIRHLFKLIWNRKRANGLIMLELFFSFLVVFALTTLGSHLYRAYQKPLGFDWRNVWAITVGSDTAADETWLADNAGILHRMLLELEAIPEIEAASYGSSAPYDGNVSNYNRTVDGRLMVATVLVADQRYAEVLDLDLIAGRWFDESDAALDRSAVVIDQEAADDLYPGEDPLGRPFPIIKDDSRIVGVVRDFRKSGEFDAPSNFAFEYRDPRQASRGVLLVRVAPEATAALEERIVRRLQAISSEMSYDIRYLERMRRSALNEVIAPMIGGIVVGGFLMLMVALGLIGVLWQNVTQRTREIGLRRAAGANEGNIHRQIVTELLLITTISAIAGVLTVVQVPIFDLFQLPVTRSTAGLGLAIALVGIYLLAILCALYPSLAATRVPPAEALHYE